MAPDLLRAMQTPALAMLLGRTASSNTSHFDAFARALPHERWFGQATGLQANSDCPGLSPAVEALRHFGLAPDEGFWFMVHPVHLHVARDHLVLTDPRRLALDDAAARALFEAIAPICRDYGHDLRYGDTNTWFLRADDWHDLQTATPDASCGHNIDIWMPQGETAVDWRKLQNEIQMHWHDHHANQQREEAGFLTVNSVWLWGGASASASPVQPIFDAAFNLSGWMQTAAGCVAEQLYDDATATNIFNNPAMHKLLLLDQLLEASLGEDLGEWLLRIQSLEQEWFTPLLQALKNGVLTSCTLVLTNSTMYKELRLTRQSLRKFWHRPALTALRT